MLHWLRDILYKAIGLNKLQHQIQSELAEIRSLLSEIRIINKTIGGNIEAQQANSFDRILENRLDEKLNFYFRWRLPVQFSENSQTFIHTNDGHRLYVDTKEPFMTLHLLEHGEWETPVRRELKRELSQGGTFIDIGANIGLHTLYATTLIGATGKVIALEPHPVTRELFRKNLEINGLLDRVTISPLAVSSEDDATVLFEYFAEHPAMSGLKVSKEILEKFNGTLEKIEVNTITIDTLVERLSIVPDLIKIDVEGFEYKVLQGCVKTIENHKNVRFLMEYEKLMAESVMQPGIGHEIADFFEGRDFKVYRINEKNLHLLSYAEFPLEERGDYIFSRQ